MGQMVGKWAPETGGSLLQIGDPEASTKWAPNEEYFCLTAFDRLCLFFSLEFWDMENLGRQGIRSLTNRIMEVPRKRVHAFHSHCIMRGPPNHF